MQRLILMGCVVTIAIAAAAVLNTAAAWGDEGHEIVGVIAYGALTPTARKKVDTLLAADHDPLTARDFIRRTTWADKFRDSDRNSTKIHYNATHNWHFVDTELDDGNLDAACNNHPVLPAGTVASAGPAHACVVDKIAQFAAKYGIRYTNLVADASVLQLLPRLGNTAAGLPFSVVLDRSGALAHRRVGEIRHVSHHARHLDPRIGLAAGAVIPAVLPVRVGHDRVPRDRVPRDGHAYGSYEEGHREGEKEKPNENTQVHFGPDYSPGVSYYRDHPPQT